MTQIRDLVGQLISLRVTVVDFETLRFSTEGFVKSHSVRNNPFISVGNLCCEPNLQVKRDPLSKHECAYLIEVIEPPCNPIL